MRENFAAKTSTWTANDYRAAAHLMGFNPHKLLFYNNLDEHPSANYVKTEEHIQGAFKYGTNVKSSPAAVTNTKTGEIAIFFEGVTEGMEKGILAHEIQHVYFFNVLGDRVSKQKLKAYTERNLVDSYVPKSLTDYADMHFMGYLDGSVPFVAFCTEVLSEMARVREVTGELVGAKVWRDLFNLISVEGKRLVSKS